MAVDRLGWLHGHQTTAVRSTNGSTPEINFCELRSPDQRSCEDRNALVLTRIDDAARSNSTLRCTPAAACTSGSGWAQDGSVQGRRVGPNDAETWSGLLRGPGRAGQQHDECRSATVATCPGSLTADPPLLSGTPQCPPPSCPWHLQRWGRPHGAPLIGEVV